MEWDSKVSSKAINKGMGQQSFVKGNKKGMGQQSFVKGNKERNGTAKFRQRK